MLKEKTCQVERTNGGFLFASAFDQCDKGRATPHPCMMIQASFRSFGTPREAAEINDKGAGVVTVMLFLIISVSGTSRTDASSQDGIVKKGRSVWSG